MNDTVHFFLPEDGIGLLTINRPEVRNALNWEAMYALREAVVQAENRPSLRALILTGAGQRAFISGGDVRDLHGSMSKEDALHQHDLMSETLARLAALPIPVIAAMEGATRGGGCEVALACDLRIAAQDATLGFAQVTMGVTPGWSGGGRLFELVGYSRALELLSTGCILTASEALGIGLIDRISPPGEALEHTQTLAQQIASGPPRAIRGIKEILQAFRALSPDTARLREREIFANLWASADHAEASAAFLEKRSPIFRGE